MERFDRTKNLIGSEKVNLLTSKKVAIFGIGGVGGYVLEGLARAGIQNFVLIDDDVVSKSNINRQIIALESTIGKNKVDVAKARVLDINPKARVQAICQFVTLEYVQNMDFSKIDYVVDAIDNITAKIALAEQSQKQGFKLISCMGTGNKLCPEMFEIADIYKTSVCPLAKVMRKELKDRGVKNLTVLYSKEQPIKTEQRTPASISFTPSIAGLRIAEYVIKDLLC
ncbi:MAG: tRNA threonylcarbamoyladenosine dehydratase [Clostridiales bacterium]|nr:tRNA threonylcarbamoyladenosine dehydratase [Clostridiales bacterium]